MLDLLRHRRDFRLLWSGGLISLAGDWILYAALPYYVYARTGSTVATAGMIAAELVPHVVLGSLAGVFVDRWDRRRVMVIGNLLQAMVVLTLLLAVVGPLWIVFVVAALQSSLAAFTGPAEGALLPNLVPNEELVRANGMNALNNRLARLLGIPVGGVLLGSYGLAAVVAVDVLSFIVAAVLISMIQGPGRAGGGELDPSAVLESTFRRFWTEWKDGLGLALRDRSVSILFVLFGLMTFGGTMIDPLDVAWVRDVLGQGPEVYSALRVTHAVAGLLGGLLIVRFLAQASPSGLVGWASVIAGVALLVRYNLPSVPLALSLSLVGGLVSVASSIGVETMLQRGVPDRYRGRIYGALGTSGALLSLLGAGIGGVLAELVGIVPMLSVAATLTIVAGIVALQGPRLGVREGNAVAASVRE